MRIWEKYGRWQAEFWIVGVDGRRRRVRRATGVDVGEPSRAREYEQRKRQAEAAAQQLQRAAQLEASGLASAPRPAVPLEQALGALIKRKEQGQRSRATIEIVLQKAVHLFAYFGPDRDVHAITEEELRSYAEVRREQGAVPGTIERELRHLREALALFGDRLSKVELGKVYVPRERFLEPSEFVALLKAMRRYSERSGKGHLLQRRDWIIVHAHTQLPSSVLARLRRDDIDLQRGTARLRHATRQPTVIPLPDPVLEIVRARVANTPIFPPWTSMARRISELCAQSGVEKATPETLPSLLAAWTRRVENNAVEDKCDHLIMYVHLGLTYSELYRIRAADIDWEGNQVFVRGTKTEHRLRVVPMSPEVREVLARRAQRKPMFAAWASGNMHRDLAAGCELAGIPLVTANDLRRTFATWLARSGVPALHLAKLMGHGSTRMLETVYARVERGQHLHDAIAQLPRATSD